jgi:hypothetical protein
MFAATQLWGKLGRAYMLALSERQYTRTYRENLDHALTLTLKAWLKILDKSPRRALRPGQSEATDFVIFTDGYHPDKRKNETGEAQIGGLIFEAGGPRQPEYFSEQVKGGLMNAWIKRENQIVMVELFAPVVAVHLFEERLKDKKLLIFVDSEAVEGALVKGYSSRSDLSELTGKFWEQMARINCTVYIDRVSTDSNPADGPSRPGKDIPEPALGWSRKQCDVEACIPKAQKRAWAEID